MAETWIAHLHAGGCDACLREWEAAWQELAGRGLRRTADLSAAPVLVMTGMPNELGAEALAGLLAGWAADGPGLLLLAGDCAIRGGVWARLGAPGVVAGVAVTGLPDTVRVVRVPGDPPAPTAIVKALRDALSSA